jgi:hypothetical protein
MPKSNWRMRLSPELWNNGLGRVMVKLAVTSSAPIALTFLVMTSSSRCGSCFFSICWLLTLSARFSPSPYAARG